ncbi:MAG: alpha/beta fold hydrolase [Luteibaculaceae bacterium]
MRNYIVYFLGLSMLLLSNVGFTQWYYKGLKTVSSFDELEYPYEVKKIDLSNNITLAYADQGRGENTLLFIHGLGSYGPAWINNMQELKNNFRCIVVDLPGYGKSSKSNYSGKMSFYAEVIIELIEALNLRNVTLVGHSMGGQISMVTALKRPEIIKNLVLVAPAGIETFTEGEKDWFRTAITAKSVMLTPLTALEENLGNNFYKMPRDAHFMMQHRFQMTGAGDEFFWYCNIIPKCVKGMVDEPVFRDLPKIKQPTLVIFGESDKLIPNRFLHGGSPKSIGEKAVEMIPNASLLTIKKAGHFVMFEQSEQVNNAIREFIIGTRP